MAERWWVDRQAGRIAFTDYVEHQALLPPVLTAGGRNDQGLITVPGDQALDLHFRW